ncbi:DyP-type peroxidase [Mycena leptocephala]|nr:DyP-type peroxidase [Mycena leptocephala]
MRKPVELFFFFSISNTAAFKAKLKRDILPLVTSTTQILNNVTAAPSTLVNIAQQLNDPPFAAGQVNDVKSLSDPGTTNWVPQFVGTSIHGVILFGSDTEHSINRTLASLQSKLGNTITEKYSLRGAMRAPPNKGHEHFGFLDGISNPTINALPGAKPGQAVVPAGEIIVGQPGDNATRPAWAKDGSFLVFRQLKQLVPNNPIVEPGLTPEQGSDLLGARMVGRWKSGAPVFLSPMFDDPALGRNDSRNNDFTFAEPGQRKSNLTDQSKCPLSAHIRKTRPRADLKLPENSTHHIVRAGIPYGPEVTSDETSSNTTKIERGLAFVAYQSNISNGFQFLQEMWANNPGMALFASYILSRAAGGAERPILLSINADFVISRGGEYFFAPSLSAIAHTLSV